jgi:hypothetical protein
MSGVISEGTIKYLAYDPDPAASFKLADFKFDAPNFTATTQLHSLYDATDPDLSSFAAAGGKLILWHGLADPHISPLNTVAYYEAMQKVLGADKVDQFARLFLFPGGAHCGGGEGPFDMDLMSAIMTWVEKSKAPDVLIASHRKGDAAPGAGPPRDTSGVPPGGPGGPRVKPSDGPPSMGSAPAKVHRQGQHRRGRQFRGCAAGATLADDIQMVGLRILQRPLRTLVHSVRYPFRLQEVALIGER